tara:strand:- start:68 stop:637 length:570 start_codon:yes stop_codon:yes gene_type:complete
VQQYILEAKKFIPPSICKKIIAYFDEGLKEAEITNNKGGANANKKIRNCTTSYLLSLEKISFGQTIVLNYIKSKLHDVGDAYHKRHNEFYLKTLNQIDLLKYEANEYEAGYKYHIDASGKTAHRIISISICLNNDFNGGEFKFLLPNGEELQYPQNVGDLIMFPSNFMFPHQVNKVTQGTRYALIAWGV